MIELRRFLPLFWPAAFLGVALLAANVTLHVLNATPVLGWLPNVVSGRGFLEDNRQRVTAAAQACRDDPDLAARPLCAIVGLSGIREGIDLASLSAVDGSQSLFLGLGAAGIGISEVADQANTLLATDLRPQLVVIAIGPHQLVDPPLQGARKPQPGLVDHLRRGDLRNAAIAVRNWIWFYSRRKDVNAAVDNGLKDMRAHMLHALACDLPAAAVGHRSPWREMMRLNMPHHFSQATLEEELDFFRGRGAFNSESYRASSQAATLFIKLISDFRERGSVVTVLLLPERSSLREQVPGSAGAFVGRVLRESFPYGTPRVIDRRNAVADEGFVDQTHLNSSGRAQFSPLLGRDLAPYLRPSYASRK